MFDKSTTVEAFLDAAAARKPTPGGGSVTALVGALAASMGEMALNYSIGKKGFEAFEPELKPALAELTRARLMLLVLMVEDQAAFEAMSATRKLAPTDPEKIGRFNAALLACVRIPEAIAASSVAVLELVDRILGFVNPFLLSDLAVCADLAMASTRCAIYNVRANLPDVVDPTDRTAIEGTIRSVLSRAATLIQQISPRIWERHALEIGTGL